MNYKIRWKKTNLGSFYVTTLLQKLSEGIREKYPEHSFEDESNDKYSRIGQGTISSPMNLSVYNPLNQKYIIVSCVDNWKTHFMPHLGWKPKNMVKMFYSGGFNYLDYYSFCKEQSLEPNLNFYSPFYYGPYNYDEQELITDLFENRKETKQELVFRGLLFKFRANLVKYINDSSIQIYDRRGDKVSDLKYSDYLKELSEYKAALSLPGATEICNRDIECFAVGTPVVRPLLHTKYEDPLLPDYHYINCYVDAKYYDGNPNYNNIKDFGKYLIQTWDKVKHDKDYLEFVSRNAREWYIKNCLIENNVSYLLSKIKLEDING